MELTTKQIHILRHSLGLDEKGHGNQYRNYYCSSKDCDGYDGLWVLCDMGLMRHYGTQERNQLFAVTEQGKIEALRGVVYPKLTRSQKRFEAYRNWHDAFGGSFREFLKTESAKAI